MSTGVAEGISGGPPIADIPAIEPIGNIRGRWPRIIAAVVTIAMFVGLGRQLFGSGLAGLGQRLPGDPLFYVAILLIYMVPQGFDFLIFRRLWGLPVSGLVALTKKRIANDTVVGYSGDAYFYAWARTHAPMVRAPFGAVKDVAILSGIAGNLVTLAALAVALPFAWRLLTADQFRLLAWSSAAIMAVVLPFALFARRVFSLSAGWLRIILGVHCARIITGATMTALVWHLGAPQVTLGAWLVLAAARMLVSRLPLVPSNDLLFANFAILIIGQNNPVASLIAVTVALTLVLHVAVFSVFTAAGQFGKRR